MLSSELSTGLILITLALAIISFIAAYGCFHFCMRVARETRDYRALLLHIRELEDLHEALAASHKRLRSRVGMRELRSKRKAANDDDGAYQEDQDVRRANGQAPESIEDWKKRTRLEMREKGLLR